MIVIVVIALIAWMLAQRRARDMEMRRDAASAHRDEAQARSRTAAAAEAEAKEQAARAERARLEAEETAARATEQRQAAEEHETLADRIDPDVEVDESATTDTEERRP